MKRWRAAFLLAFLGALPTLFAWNRSAGLLEDSDTRGILGAIRAAHDPLKWFRGDWPIANHFYRPVASLVFEADNALWGANAAGYGLTNALLCFGCVLALFWALREVTDRPAVAVLGASLFSLWNVAGAIRYQEYRSPSLTMPSIIEVGAWITLLVGMFRHRRNWKAYVPAFLTLLTLANEVLPIRLLGNRMLDWIPGRTASTMTLFALVAIAAYARYERLRRPAPEPAEIGPETRPATRRTEESGRRGVAWPWAVGAVLATALALGSYEQAVMLPAVLTVVGLAMRLRTSPHPNPSPPEGRGAFALHAVFWGMLVAYAGLRWALLPHDPSGYQRQQFSSNRTALWAEMQYLFPPLEGVAGIPTILGAGLIMLLFPTPYLPLWSAAVTSVGYYQARKGPVPMLFGLLGSAVAYLPMAWFKLFDHYHYWPMAMRSAFVVGLGLAAARLAATAVCPPAQPAPPRPRHAPGSLPRP